MLSNKQGRFSKWVLMLTATILVLGVLAGCGKNKESKDALVVYKGGQVTKDEFEKFKNINKTFYPEYAQFFDDPNYQQELMNQYLTFKILSGRITDKAKADADKKVKEQVDQIKAAMDAQGGADAMLKENKLVMKDIEEFVRQSVYSLTAMEANVADDQVKAEYDKVLKEDKDSYTVATVRHILVGITDASTGKELRKKEEALARAKEVQDKLNKGGNFDTLAKEYSDDPGSKDNGGKYEDAEISQWVPEFKKAAAELAINKISDPVETEYGYHVMKVESRKTKTFDEVKDALKSGLAEQKVYEFAEKELPGLIEKNNLPKPEEASPSPAASPTPSASPSPSPAAK